jgi:spermidine synthase
VPGFAREGRPLEDLPPRYQPATYYVQGSGVGLAIERHPNYVAKKPFKIGVVGLGTGTIAAYGRPGDEIRFYEIDETVKELSEQYFTFRQDSLAKATDVVLGDARVQMEREEPQNYDVLAIDAFSGDAIPVHLLTRECLAVYQKHLKPDGILAVHISNRYLDLAPVVRALAQRGEMRVESFHYLEGQRPSKVQDTASEWMLVTKNSDFFNDEVVADAITPQLNTRVIEWTDQYSNLSDILQW